MQELTKLEELLRDLANLCLMTLDVVMGLPVADALTPAAQRAALEVPGKVPTPKVIHSDDVESTTKGSSKVEMEKDLNPPAYIIPDEHQYKLASFAMVCKLFYQWLSTYVLIFCSVCRRNTDLACVERRQPSASCDRTSFP